MLEIDDVDPTALAEDEAAHLGIPATSLVTEVDSGLQELPHGYGCHDCLLLVDFGTAGRGGWNRSKDRHHHPHVPPGRLQSPLILAARIFQGPQRLAGTY